MNWLEWTWTLISIWSVGVVLNNYISRYTTRKRYEETMRLSKGGYANAFDTWLTVDAMTFVGSLSWLVPFIVILIYIFTLGKDTGLVIYNGIREARKKEIRDSTPLHEQGTVQSSRQARRHGIKGQNRMAFTVEKKSKKK